MRFVVGVIKDGQPDPTLGEVVMAQDFGESRASLTYDARAEGIAADLADGQPPELVRRFRTSIREQHLQGVRRAYVITTSRTVNQTWS